MLHGIGYKFMPIFTGSHLEYYMFIVFFNHLPPTAADKSYQLWVIRADMPEPQSAGTFEVGLDGKATLGVTDLPVNTEIKAFALTLEPRGGGKSPTGPKVLVGS